VTAESAPATPPSLVLVADGVVVWRVPLAARATVLVAARAPDGAAGADGPPTLVVVGGADGSVSIVDADTGRAACAVLAAGSGPVRSLAVVRGGAAGLDGAPPPPPAVLALTCDGALRSWRLARAGGGAAGGPRFRAVAAVTTAVGALLVAAAAAHDAEGGGAVSATVAAATLGAPPECTPAVVVLAKSAGRRTRLDFTYDASAQAWTR
jgi:hypothetical protein